MLATLLATLDIVLMTVALTPIENYPESPRGDHQDVYHGVTVDDPWQWLEVLNSEPVQAWMEAQDALARSRSVELEGRARVAGIFNGLSREVVDFPPVFVAQSAWFFRVTRGEPASWEIIRQSENGEEETIVSSQVFTDPPAAARGTGEPRLDVRPDGRFVAFGLTPRDSLWASWRVFDAEERKLLPLTIEGVHENNPGAAFGASDSLATIRYDRAANDEPVSPRLVVTDLMTGEDKVRWSDEATVSAQVVGDSGAIAIVASSAATFSLWMANGEGRAFAKLIEVEAWLQWAGLNDGRPLLLTNLDAPNRRVVKVSEHGELEDVLAESEHVINAAHVRAGKLLVYRTVQALPSIAVEAMDGSHSNTLALPYHGWIRSGFTGDSTSDQAGFSYQGTGEPDTVYRIDLNSEQVRIFRPTANRFASERFDSRQVFFESTDGVEVPMILTTPKGADGPQPLWLYAYGSNWAAVPWYSPRFRAWLDLGGSYALVNIRGGGEFGQDWIDAGAGLNKQTGIDDYLAAARWLIDRGITDNQRLVANGGSASGPVAAAAVNQAPELFGAVAIDYPVIDVLRQHLFAAGTGAGNWGSAEHPDQFAALRSWSPLHNLRRQCLPPTFIAHTDNDASASPLHSFKLAAAWQSHQTCGNPVLLQVARGYGHTVGGEEEMINQITFLAHAVGLLAPPRHAASARLPR